MSSLKTFRKQVKKAASNVKKTALRMDKASKSAGMSKAFGVNGPIGVHAIDFIYPGFSDGVGEHLLEDRSDKVKEARLEFKKLYGTSLGKAESITKRLKFLAEEDSEANGDFKKLYSRFLKGDVDTDEVLEKEPSTSDKSKAKKVLEKGSTASPESAATEGAALALGNELPELEKASEKPLEEPTGDIMSIVKGMGV